MPPNPEAAFDPTVARRRSLYTRDVRARVTLHYLDGDIVWLHRNTERTFYGAQELVMFILSILELTQSPLLVFVISSCCFLRITNLTARLQDASLPWRIEVWVHSTLGGRRVEYEIITNRSYLTISLDELEFESDYSFDPPRFMSLSGR